MLRSRSTGVVTAGLAGLLICASGLADEPPWLAGEWDSAIYNRSERPRTVAIRIELADAETALPISGAKVRLRGFYLEEELNRKPPTYAPQEREFQIAAVSDRGGIVVFALSWSKRYPWDLGEPPYIEKRQGVRTRDVYSSWIRPVDDVEKVQELKVLHPRYQAVEEPFDFRHLLHVGQNPESELQEPRVFEAFERAWKQEITAPGVKFCVLDLGTDFRGFEDRESRRPEFFERIRTKDFGTVYREPRNWFSKGEHPQSECGPYFVYLLEIRLVRRSGIVDVEARDPRPHRASTERRRHDESRRSTESDRTRPRRESERAGSQGTSRESTEGLDSEAQKAERERRAREQQLLEQARKSPLGIVVETLTASKRRGLGLYLGTSGVVVVFVAPKSPAAAGGLRAGTVIESVTHRAVTDVASFRKHIGAGRPGSQYMIGIWRKNAKGKWERANRSLRIAD